MKANKIVSALVLTVLATGVISTAQANTVTGNLWHVPEAITGNAVPGNVPATTPDVTFQVNSPFNFSGSNVTVGTWLSSSSAFNIVENTPNTLTSLMDNGVTGTLLNFTGFVTVTNGQTFTVTHDDGLTLYIGGLLVVNAPGPTAPITTTATYTGPSGTFAFQLVYAECCQGPAVLQISLPLSDTPVPEPGTLALLGLGLVGLGMTRRRKA